MVSNLVEHSVSWVMESNVVDLYEISFRVMLTVSQASIC